MTERQEDQRLAESIGQTNLDRVVCGQHLSDAFAMLGRIPEPPCDDAFLDRGANSLFGQPLIRVTSAALLADLLPDIGEERFGTEFLQSTGLCGPESRL